VGEIIGAGPAACRALPISGKAVVAPPRRLIKQLSFKGAGYG
jgi:hypothetical protein